ncbi:hypothetical protein HRG_001669 [Hirsutella rhossiliensis]|uniref:Rhodopsin domain-containing protein n=1 Tax=Hirsutella rhossiliensis TaxID=111463 RepID=A0A9P8SLY2_9HYPO|nr:uncharacterized protein HRG_01669 [Hirsutella rhossiliensis]KAH0966260.1 hypothetical protein HRG_01669 [Hirsutella rhossiliensis]
MFAKTSILLEFIHLFVPGRTRNKFFWICWAMIVANCLFYLASIVAVQFYCTPVEKNWHRWVPGTCRDRSTIDITPTVFNLVFDLLILLLPQRVIWTLQMNNRRKLGVSIVFSVGLLGCICAGGRIAYTVHLHYKTNVAYDSGPIYLWSIAECTCAILVFCAPALPKAFRSTKEGTSTMSNGGRPSFGQVTNTVQSNKSYYKMADGKHRQDIALSEIQFAAPERASA